jgi:hypothetical protein
MSTGSSDVDEPAFFASDHAPLWSTFELELPVLPLELPLHHCTIYLTGLELYRAMPTRRLSYGGSGLAESNAFREHGVCTARTAQGKGVSLPVAGSKLQNLPPQLTVYAHMLVLHRLMGEPPHLAAALNADGRSATNIVIGPMLAQKEFLALQQIQLRVVTQSGGKQTELGQAVFSLEQAAGGRPASFDVIVERFTVPAGFNLRGACSIVYTKSLADEALTDSSRASSSVRRTSGGSRAPPLGAVATRHGLKLSARASQGVSQHQGGTAPRAEDASGVGWGALEEGRVVGQHSALSAYDGDDDVNA